VVEAQVHLTGETQHVPALGKPGEAGENPIENREMRGLVQKGRNQAKVFHRKPGVQQSSTFNNLQHLREYNSCQIWASQSRRPPYVAEVQEHARIERVAASIHECYMDVHGKKLVKDAIFKTPCVVIIFDKAPRFREAKSNFGCKQMRRTAGREREQQGRGRDALLR